MNLNRQILGLVAIVFTLAGLAYGAPPCEPGYLCYCSSPIIIDLEGKGIQLTDAANGVFFDIAADGKPVKLAWTTPGVRNAWLALDRNGNGRIDNGQELFGNFTPQPDCNDPNGFFALAQYDKPENGGNADGLIDSHDAVYLSLRLWIDANHNGTSESDELFTLPTLSVSSISLDYKLSRKHDRYGNTFRYRAKVNVGIKDDLGPFAWDVFLASQQPPPAKPRENPSGIIIGAQTPEQIPTEVAYGIFLRIASCTDDDPELYKKKCLLVQQAIGLNDLDLPKVPAHLKGFHEEISALDDQIALLGRSKTPEVESQRTTLIAQRHNFVQEKVAGLRQKLSSDGKQKFDAYIETMKTKMKFIPSATPEELKAN